MRVCFVEDKGKKSKYVIKTKSRRTGLKTIPTACTFSRDGLLVAAACQDGSIQMWDHRKTFVNVALQAWKHKKIHNFVTMENSEIFTLCIKNIFSHYSLRMDMPEDQIHPA